MRGKVLNYHRAKGVGFIIGDSGVRYSFAKADLRRLAPFGEGSVVEFHPQNDTAREVFIVDETPVAAPVRFGRFAELNPAPVPTVGVWAYAHRCVTDNYANFRDRARRKEYWGFFLLWFVAGFCLILASIAADAAMGNLDGQPILTIALPVLYVLGTFIPALAVNVRRLHDIGLSGWFYLLVFIPTVGSLIILVMALIPTQNHINRWGPVPEGIVSDPVQA